MPNPFHLLAGLGLFALALPASAGDLPLRVFQGTLDGRPLEVALYHGKDTLSGYLLERDSQRVTLFEETPWHPDEGVLLNLMDDPKMPSATLQLAPFRLDAPYRIQGARIDLRDRTRQAVKLQDSILFRSDRDRAWDGELQQPDAGPRMSVRVHASKPVDTAVGTIDRITVHDLQSGQDLAPLDNLQLQFDGSRSLTFDDYNNDGVIDFSAWVREAEGAPKVRQYFLYQADTQRYERCEPLEQLAQRGDLRHSQNGPIQVLTGRRFDTSTEQWETWQFEGPRQLTLTNSFETRF